MTRDNTPDRIAAAALQLIAQQGARKSDLDEVARQAGVTRVTVYRHFGDKQGLVRAACSADFGLFCPGPAEFPADTTPDMDERLLQLAADLRELPPGNLLQRLDEISRLYPAVYQEFRTARERPSIACWSSCWNQPGGTARCATICIRMSCSAVFRSAVIGLIENPALISSNVSLADVLANVQEIFCHGILKPPSELGIGRQAACGHTQVERKASHEHGHDEV